MKRLSTILVIGALVVGFSGICSAAMFSYDGVVTDISTSREPFCKLTGEPAYEPNGELPAGYTVTVFHIATKEIDCPVYREQEYIESDSQNDMSVLIALAREAFSTGQVLRVSKSCDIPKDLLRAYYELKEEIEQLDASYKERISRYEKIRSKIFAEAYEIYEQYRNGKITYEEYMELIMPLVEEHRIVLRKIKEDTAKYQEERGILVSQLSEVEFEIAEYATNARIVSLAIRKIGQIINKDFKIPAKPSR